MLFVGLKDHYYPGEDITLKYEVETTEGLSFVDGFICLYPKNYNNAQDWIMNKRVERKDDGYVIIPCKFVL